MKKKRRQLKKNSLVSGYDKITKDRKVQRTETFYLDDAFEMFK